MKQIASLGGAESFSYFRDLLPYISWTEGWGGYTSLLDLCVLIFLYVSYQQILSVDSFSS